MEITIALALLINVVSMVALIMRLNVLLDLLENVVHRFGKQPDDPRYKSWRVK